MDLKPYWEKRHFAETPEPRGEVEPSGNGLLFVVQMHDASHLHFDFRLEMGGVLKSWAVPKGPSLDPADKRLAVEVEDHPKAYGRFEGVIPPAQYGGGTVLLWDRGLWLPEGDPVAGYRKGHLRFSLQGERLKGRWSLLRMNKAGESRSNWLLVKARDRHAGRKAVTPPETVTSVVSGLTLQEIAARKTGPAAKAGTATAAVRQAGKATPPPARKKTVATMPLPAFIEPQLATLVSEIPRDGQWLSELKFDGYRLLARVQDGQVSLWTRNRQDWTAKLPDIARDMAALGLQDAWLDGELVAVDKAGHGSFELLQQAFASKRPTAKADSRLLYYVFDMPFLEGRDLRELPQQERKQLLKKTLHPAAGNTGALRYSDHISGRMADVYQQACLQGEEGIIIKAADAGYAGGRGLHWLKLKCLHRQEFVIGAYSDPEGGREGLGALLLGYHDEAGRLVYVGRTGTGFSQEQLRRLQARLARLERKTSPFAQALTRREAEGVHWVTPQLVAEVKFAGWTRHHRLRQASFLGLRDDKPAQQVQEERPDTRISRVVGKTPRTDKVAGVKISHPGRLVYPGQDISKIDVARHYEHIAAHLLPQLAGRPLSLLRCPDGIGPSCFFQKHMTEGMPACLRTVAVEEEAGQALYMMVDTPRALLSLVQMGVLEFHTWGARSDRLDRPDRMVFDLDPGPGVAWKEMQDAALLIRALLRELGLPAFLKTSGGKGLHVEVPLLRVHSWEEIKDFSRGIALHLQRELPDRFVAAATRSRRRGRIFIDYLRNAAGATTIAAYSLRARAGAAVATPLRWKELPDIESADAFTLANIGRRLAALRKDPWAAYESERVRISKSLRQAMREPGGR